MVLLIGSCPARQFLLGGGEQVFHLGIGWTHEVTSNRFRSDAVS